jgi:hypothetical protein
MKKLALFAVALLTFSACGSASVAGPEKTPEEMMRMALENEMEMLSGSFEMAMEGEVTDSASKEVYMFDGTMGMVADARDEAKLAFSMDIDFNLNNETMGENHFAGSMVMADNMFYFMLKDLGQFGAMMPVPLNQWLKTALPEDAMTMNTAALGNFAAMSEELKAVVLEKGVEILGELKYAGVEEVEGRDAYMYEWTFNADAFGAYMDSLMEVSGEEALTDADKAAIEEILEKMTISGTAYIDVEKVVTVRMDIDVMAKDLEGMSLDMNFDYLVKDMGGDVKIEVPADAKDLNEAMGGIMPGVETTETMMMEEVAQ